MTKYKLQKPLPLAQAGCFLEYDSVNECYRVDNSHMYSFPRGIVEGDDGRWFKLEEVKEEQPFVWTDALVVEFASWSATKSPTFQGRYADLEQFKSSHQPITEKKTEGKRDKDWKILLSEVDGREYSGDKLPEEINKNNAIIKMVRRVSDNTIWQVGELASYFGIDNKWHTEKIISFQLLRQVESQTNDMMVFFSESGCESLSRVKKENYSPESITENYINKYLNYSLDTNNDAQPKPKEQATEKGRVPDIQPMLDQAYNTAIDQAIKTVKSVKSFSSDEMNVTARIKNQLISKLEALKTKA